MATGRSSQTFGKQLLTMDLDDQPLKLAISLDIHLCVLCEAAILVKARARKLCLS
jgi:hypothetical protein